MRDAACGRFFAPPEPADYKFCYQAKGHDGPCQFEPRRRSAARMPRWGRHSDLLRTQLQQTGRIRLAFLTLDDLYAVASDLGIHPDAIVFRDGYAVVVGEDSHA